MGAKKTIYLDRIKKGQFMSWFITTQAANRIHVKLYDDNHVYVNDSKQSRNIEPPLSQGSAFVYGYNLKMDISLDCNTEIKTWLNMSDISSVEGKCVGESFSLAGEDQTDDDYNDIYVSISAWDKAY